MKNSTTLYDKLFKAAMATSVIAVVASNMAKAANRKYLRMSKQPLTTMNMLMNCLNVAL
ncbi:hypothetical protein ABH966_002050 [Lysinibacillus sp. RC46]